jgi:acetolactate synthase-1/2/3 large subunit
MAASMRWRAEDRRGGAIRRHSVFEANSKSNISYDSPCFAGFSPDEALPEADFGLLVDVEVPWFPADVQAERKAFWAHIDVDVLKLGSPMWTFPGTLRMQGDSGRILDQLLDRAEGQGDAAL